MKKMRKEMSFTQKQAAATKQAFMGMAKSLLAAGTAVMVVRAGMRIVSSAIRTVISNTNEAAAGLEDIGHTAEKLGLATSELMALRRAAELTGSNAATLDMAIQRLVRRIGEVAVGSGEAAITMKRMGMDAKRLAEMPVINQIKAVAQGLSEIRNKNVQLAATMKFVDSEGVALTNMFRDGAKGINEYIRQAERLGLLFSDEEIGRIKKYRDAMSDLGREVTAIWQRIAVEVAPVITAMLQARQELLLLAQHPSFVTLGIARQATLRNVDAQFAPRPQVTQPSPFDAARRDAFVEEQKRLEGIGKEAFESTRTAAEKAAVAIADLTKAHQAGHVPIDVYHRKLRALSKTLADFEKQGRARAEFIRDSLLTPVEQMRKTLEGLQRARKDLGPEFFFRGVRQAMAQTIEAEKRLAGRAAPTQTRPQQAQVSRFLMQAVSQSPFEIQAERRRTNWEKRSTELWMLSVEMLADIRDNTAATELEEFDG
jgi:hypothetical protein